MMEIDNIEIVQDDIKSVEKQMNKMVITKSVVLVEKNDSANFWDINVDSLLRLEDTKINLTEIVKTYPFVYFQGKAISTIFYLLKYEPKKTSFDILRNLGYDNPEKISFGEVITILFYINHYNVSKFLCNVNTISKLKLNSAENLVLDYPTKFIFKLTGKRPKLNSLSIRNEKMLKYFNLACNYSKKSIAILYSTWINCNSVNSKNILNMEIIGTPYHRISKILGNKYISDCALHATEENYKHLSILCGMKRINNINDFYRNLYFKCQFDHNPILKEKDIYDSILCRKTFTL